VTATSPRLRVDFQNADTAGRVRLTTVGTREDVAAQRLSLEEGLVVTLVDDELAAQAVVRWSDHEHVWVAELTSKITDA